MKTIKNLFSKDTILEFNIGRGGRFYNGGYLTFQKVDSRIDQTSAFSNLFLPEEDEENLNAEYRDECGNGVGLTVGEAKTGLGRIDIDGEYDTTYCTRIEDLSEDEQEVIVRDSSGWERMEIFAAMETYTNLSIILAEEFNMYDELIAGENIEDNFESSDEEPDEYESVCINGKYYWKAV